MTRPAAFLFVSSLALLGLGLSTPARACINEYVRIYILPTATRKVERTESQMASGQSRRAFRTARELFERVVGGTAVDRENELLESADDWGENVNTGGDSEAVTVTQHPDRAAAIERRVSMLYAILVVRVDGQITREGRAVRSVHPDVRAEHMTAARAALAALLADTPDDPRLRAYHAEATIDVSDEARVASLSTLRDLGTRDLVTDPMTWVALASLERDDAQNAALARCQAMVSRGAGRVCVVP